MWLKWHSLNRELIENIRAISFFYLSIVVLILIIKANKSIITTFKNLDSDPMVVVVGNRKHEPPEQDDVRMISNDNIYKGLKFLPPNLLYIYSISYWNFLFSPPLGFISLWNSIVGQEEKITSWKGYYTWFSKWITTMREEYLK